MKSQTHLNLGNELPPVTRMEPILWVKTFAVYEDLKPDKFIRRIDLRKGLNIIWAKDSEAGASGHAAGKSTFCRMLRYLLGDSSFGTDDVRDAIRDKFPNVCVAGEVYIDGEPWLLVRTLATHGKRHSARGASFKDLFDESTKFSDYQEFVAQLDETFIEPLPAKAFPGSGKNIEWKHLLHWLTRDQDARFAHLLEWRTYQQSHETKLSASDKINLIRMVLNLLDPDEIEQQALHSTLQTQLKEVESLIPKLEYLKTRTTTKISTTLPIKEGDLAFQYDEHLKAVNEELAKVSESWKAANSQDGLDEFSRNAHEQSLQNVRDQHSSLKNAEIRLKRYHIDLQRETGEITEAERKIALSQMGPVEGLCSTPLHLAEGCPHAAGPDRDELQKSKLDQTKSGAEKLRDLIRAVEAQILSLNGALTDAQDKATKQAEKIAKVREQHAANRKVISDNVAEISANLNLLREALIELDELDRSRQKQKELRNVIEKSTEILQNFRKREEKQLSQISTYFSSVASRLLNQPVEGHVRFNADEIRPSLEYAGDMSSAALVTLRLLIFDLACLIGSQHNLTNHPGFLVHDSPREADLSSNIYRRIFSLIAGTEPEQENQAVQYIIATTEPPPAHLQEAPWLACPPLSSESPEERFLKAVV
jgi:hypothetical protein